jgi:hypothetical protein
MTISAPSSYRFCANALPSSKDEKLFVKRPSLASGSHPKTATLVPLVLLLCLTASNFNIYVFICFN